MENPTTTSRTRASSLAPVKSGPALATRQGNPRVPLGEIPVNTVKSGQDVEKSKLKQLPTFGGPWIAQQSKMQPGPSKIQDTKVWPSTNPLPFEIHQDEKSVETSAGTGNGTSSSTSRGGESWKSLHNASSASAVDNLENLVPPFSEFQRPEVMDESSVDFSEDDDEDVSSVTSNEDSPMPFADVTSRDGSLPGSDILSTVAEYTLDIVAHTRTVEHTYLVKPNYMRKQPDITFSMRSILVEWMLEVGQVHDMHTETIFLAVNYLDRFLSAMAVKRDKLQLVGTTCMFIASKYEEIHPPDVNEFCYMTADSYTKNQVLKMEGLVLKALGFRCSPPTALFFATHFSKLAGSQDDCPQTSLAHYLAELTLLDLETYKSFVPSAIGAASVALSRHYHNLKAWDSTLIEKTGYQVVDFEDCLASLHETFTNAPNYPHQIVREKYKSSEHHEVALMAPVPLF